MIIKKKKAKINKFNENTSLPVLTVVCNMLQPSQKVIKSDQNLTIVQNFVFQRRENSISLHIHPETSRTFAHVLLWALQRDQAENHSFTSVNNLTNLMRLRYQFHIKLSRRLAFQMVKYFFDIDCNQNKKKTVIIKQQVNWNRVHY